MAEGMAEGVIGILWVTEQAEMCIKGKGKDPIMYIESRGFTKEAVTGDKWVSSRTVGCEGASSSVMKTIGKPRAAGEASWRARRLVACEVAGQAGT